jgi:hypothetical protein
MRSNLARLKTRLIRAQHLTQSQIHLTNIPPMLGVVLRLSLNFQNKNPLTRRLTYWGRKMNLFEHAEMKSAQWEKPKFIKPPKSSRAYRSMWKITWGALVDTFNNHPDYITAGREQAALRSVCKRVTGAVLGFAEQSAKGRSEKSAADKPRESSIFRGKSGALLKRPVSSDLLGSDGAGNSDTVSRANQLSGDRDGETFNRTRDRNRLDVQSLDVWLFMNDGKWHTSKEIEDGTGYNWSSANARLRDWRKPQFGGHTVDRMSMGGGLFAYRLTPIEAA